MDHPTNTARYEQAVRELPQRLAVRAWIDPDAAVLLTIEKTVERKVEPLLAEIASLNADLAELRRQVADHLAEE